MVVYPKSRSACRQRTIDLAIDPPPDLAIEVEISRTVISRLPIYAEFKIPEVWRYNGKRIVVLVLGEDGKYSESGKSLALPDFPLLEFGRFVSMGDELGFIEIARRFRLWIREINPR